MLGSPAILNNIYNFTAAVAFTTGSPRFGLAALNNVNPHPLTTAVVVDAVGILPVTANRLSPDRAAWRVPR